MSNIQNFFKRYLPVVKADEGEEEELVDPQTVLRVSDNRYIMFLSFERVADCSFEARTHLKFKPRSCAFCVLKKFLIKRKNLNTVIQLVLNIKNDSQVKSEETKIKKSN